MIYMIIAGYFEDDASDELTKIFLMHTADRKAEPLAFTIRAMVIIHLSVMME